MDQKYKKYLTRRIDNKDKFENLLEFPKYIEIEIGRAHV